MRWFETHGWAGTQAHAVAELQPFRTWAFRQSPLLPLPQSQIALCGVGVCCLFPYKEICPFEHHHYQEIGNNIRTIRKQHKLTQEKMAEILSVSVGTIKKIEKGASLTLPHLLDVCQVFSCTMVELLPQDFSQYTSESDNFLRAMDNSSLQRLQHILSREEATRSVK